MATYERSKLTVNGDVVNLRDAGAARFDGAQTLTDAQKAQARANIGAVSAGEAGVTGVKGDAESEYRAGNVNLTAANLGLGNVNNTADADKPVSTAQAQALAGKVDKVTGKGLSTNDYTDAEKAALAGKLDAASVYNGLDQTAGGYALDARQGKKLYDIIRTRGGTIYGFHIDSTEGDPEACVTYLADAVGMTPAHMNFTTGQFDWGSWRDAFFIPRPCMLKYDGTVDYYLDPDDYTKKADGVTASDAADDTYGGNAMMEWGQGGKKIWYKIIPDTGDATSATVYIADHQADGDYVAWPFINNQGEMVDHFYTPIYNGSIDGAGRLRSISGRANTELCQGKTAEEEITAAERNNPGSSKLWYTETYADNTLLLLLLILMGKSLNGQAVYGNGRCGQASDASAMLGTGTMDTRGLFYGSNDNTEGVKVFGMENFWGNQRRRYAGHMMVASVHKVKLTRGTQDGSAAEDYNTTANGYLSGATAPQNNNYITKMQFDKNGFQMKEAAGGDSAHYWCDYWYYNNGTRYALRGGLYSSSAGDAGPVCINMNRAAVYTDGGVGSAPSCKPLL